MNRDTSSINHGLMSLAWLAAGTIVTLMFATGQLAPLRVTILLLGALSVLAIATLRITELSILTRLYVLLFSLPFSATLGYLFDNDFVWWSTPTNTLLCQNHPLINEMLSMVIVGLCGMMVGIEFTAIYACRPRRRVPAVETTPRGNATLTLPVVWIMLAVSFLFSWLHAPQESIFVAAYASADAGGGLDKEAGLNASYLISYLILILLSVDAEQEKVGSRRQLLKLTAIMAVMGYIVVILQLLRGDRECAGLVAAMGMLYITSRATTSVRNKLWERFHQMKRTMALALPLAVVVMSFLALGALRHSASSSSSSFTSLTDLVAQGAGENTWTAVALNNLGLAADYNYGNIEYLYGQTYIDYVLSLPPGAITKILGYERPLEGEANPALWYFGLIAAGGMHPVVVPFRNFGIWGVMPIMFLCGMLICVCEAYNESGTMSGRLLYGCMATSSMLWFWYGDMNMIRTLMAWGILFFIHQFTAVIPRPTFLRNPPRPQMTQRKPLAAMS